MSDLNSALDQLKSTLASGGFSAGIVEEIAAEWDVKPALLARKFKEATGADVESFRVVDTSAVEADAAKRARLREWQESVALAEGIDQFLTKHKNTKW